MISADAGMWNQSQFIPAQSQVQLQQPQLPSTVFNQYPQYQIYQMPQLQQQQQRPTWLQNSFNPNNGNIMSDQNAAKLQMSLSANHSTPVTLNAGDTAFTFSVAQPPSSYAVDPMITVSYLDFSVCFSYFFFFKKSIIWWGSRLNKRS